MAVLSEGPPRLCGVDAGSTAARCRRGLQRQGTGGTVGNVFSVVEATSRLVNIHTSNTRTRTRTKTLCGTG